MMSLREVRGFAFDLDGTIWAGPHLLPGAAEMVDALRRAGVPVVFASNSSRHGSDALARELKAVEQAINGLIKQHATPAVCSSKGLGPVFQASMLALLPELGELSRREIAKLVGVAPMNRDSGQGQGKRRIHGGRAPVRVALYMATLSAVRWDPLMKAHYQQLRARGKLGKLALVACMRKLLGIVNARRRDELRAEGKLLA